MKKLIQEIEKTNPAGNESRSRVQDCVGFVTDSRCMFAFPDFRENGVYEGKKKVEKPFPDPACIFPKEALSAATVSVSEMLGAFRFLGASAKRNAHNSRKITFLFSEEKITVQAECEDCEQEIDIEGVPVPMIPCSFSLDLLFIDRFFEFLKREKIDHCLVEFFGKNLPVLFSANEYQYLLMPLSWRE